jgi:hypothetical protein
MIKKSPERTQCGRCGRECNSPEELREHEKTCTGQWQI